MRLYPRFTSAGVSAESWDSASAGLGRLRPGYGVHRRSSEGGSPPDSQHM